MSDEVRWGVLGVAGIATGKMIPAMQRARSSRVLGIASRQSTRAREAGERLGIPRTYGGYDALLADPDIEAVYIPLPNHLHVPWSIKAAEAGKHVLCEKPIGLGADEVRTLLEAQRRSGTRIQEAFMVQAHPQWKAALDIIGSGRLGPVRVIMGHFTYCNTDPENIRNVRAFGGGALLDVGCYLVHAALRVVGAPPQRVLGSVVRGPGTDTDTLTSAVLEFDGARCLFTCGTRTTYSQRLEIIGERARLEIETPFTPPPDQPCRLFVNEGNDPSHAGDETIVVEPCDQYVLQVDDFCAAIRATGEQSLPLARSLEHAAVIGAVFRSSESGRWEAPGLD